MDIKQTHFEWGPPARERPAWIVRDADARRRRREAADKERRRAERRQRKFHFHRGLSERKYRFSRHTREEGFNDLPWEVGDIAAIRRGVLQRTAEQVAEAAPGGVLWDDLVTWVAVSAAGEPFGLPACAAAAGEEDVEGERRRLARLLLARLAALLQSRASRRRRRQALAWAQADTHFAALCNAGGLSPAAVLDRLTQGDAP